MQLTPPTLLIHGELDPIVWPMHSELLAARLKEAGRPHLLPLTPLGDARLRREHQRA